MVGFLLYAWWCGWYQAQPLTDLPYPKARLLLPYWGVALWLGHAIVRFWSVIILGRMLSARNLCCRKTWESWASFSLPSSSLFIWWQSLFIRTVATIIHWNTFTIQEAEAEEVSIWWFYGSVLTRSPSNVGACAQEDNQSFIQAGVRGSHLLNIMTPIPDRLETFWAAGQDSKKNQPRVSPLKAILAQTHWTQSCV